MEKTVNQRIMLLKEQLNLTDVEFSYLTKIKG